jgi:hypothetical protein
MDSLQHHQIGEFPIAKTRNCTPTSPDTGFASIQCRKNIHIRFQAGFVAPLAELLSNAGATMYEMYATRVKPENAVVTLVARRPDRIINPEVVYAFVGVEHVKFVFLAGQQRLLQGLRLSNSSPGLIRRSGQNPGLPGAGVPQ